MKFLFVLFAAIAIAQNTTTVTVTGPKNAKTYNVNVRPGQKIASMVCTPNDVFEGDLVTCTVTMESAQTVALHMPLLFGGAGAPSTVDPRPAFVDIPVGGKVATFTFRATIPAPPSTPPIAWHVLPNVLHATVLGQSLGLPVRFISVMYWRMV